MRSTPKIILFHYKPIILPFIYNLLRSTPSLFLTQLLKHKGVHNARPDLHSFLYGLCGIVVDTRFRVAAYCRVLHFEERGACGDTVAVVVADGTVGDLCGKGDN